MKPLVFVTDLDGTLLESDGTAREEVALLLRQLRGRGIPVHAITSKTAMEAAALVEELGLTFPAGVENGAGVVGRDGRVNLGEKAVALPTLREIASALKERSQVLFRTLEELDDQTLSGMVKLPLRQIPAVRARKATLPLVCDPQYDQTLTAYLPSHPRVRLVRGNRFLHLQGDHGKADVFPLLLGALTREDVFLVGLGDSPNDYPLLAACDLAFVVSSNDGGHPLLRARLPTAQVTPYPHGAGWVWAVQQALEIWEKIR